MNNFAGWLLNVIDDIKQTLIVEDRYLLIFDGLKNTLLIAAGAIVIGTIIGTIISIIRHSNKVNGKFKILNSISKAYVSIIRGTPSLLQLMIIYYIIFKSSNINPIIVGMISFGINSGAYSSEILRGGFESVDEGQLEAGYALGLNYTQTMIKIIIPQALKNSIASMGNEFITLIKETSIAGYIGIIDLTKSSDIIASRTYDYFFPLLLVALIYFTITTCLSKLLGVVERRLNVNDKYQ